MLQILQRGAANLFILFFIIRWQIWHWHKTCAFADLQLSSLSSSKQQRWQLAGDFPQTMAFHFKNKEQHVNRDISTGLMGQILSLRVSFHGPMSRHVNLDSKPSETNMSQQLPTAQQAHRSSWNKNALMAFGLPAPSFTASFPAACRTAEITGGCGGVDGPLLETWTRETSVIMCDSVWFMDWLYCPFLSTRPQLK